MFCSKAGLLCLVCSRRESYLLNTNNARAHLNGGAPDSFQTENLYIVGIEPGISRTEGRVLTNELRRHLFVQVANIQFIEYLGDDSVETRVARQLQYMSIDESSIDYFESFLTGTTNTTSSLLENTFPIVWSSLVCGEETVTKSAIKSSKCSLFLLYMMEELQIIIKKH